MVSLVGPVRGRLLLREGTVILTWRKKTKEASRRQRESRQWSNWLQSQKAAEALCRSLEHVLVQHSLGGMLHLWYQKGTSGRTGVEKDLRLKLFGNLVRVLARNTLVIAVVQSIGTWHRRVVDERHGAGYVSNDVSIALAQLRNTLYMPEEAAIGADGNAAAVDDDAGGSRGGLVGKAHLEHKVAGIRAVRPTGSVGAIFPLGSVAAVAAVAATAAARRPSRPVVAVGTVTPVLTAGSVRLTPVQDAGVSAGVGDAREPRVGAVACPNADSVWVAKVVAGAPRRGHAEGEILSLLGHGDGEERHL